MGCVTGCSFSGFVWVVFGFCLVLFVLFGGSFLAVGMQPVLQLLLNSNKVTCAEPAHIAPRLVQKKHRRGTHLYLAQGYGRFAIRYTRLATALGNFEQGNAQAESAVVAGWLTSGLEIAMSRIGWSLLSPRQALTRLPSRTLSNYCYYGYPSCREEDRPYHQYGKITYTTSGIGSAPGLQGIQHSGIKSSAIRKN